MSWILISPGLALAATLVMVASAYSFRPETVGDQLGGFILMLVGGLFLLASLWLNRVPARWPKMSQSPALDSLDVTGHHQVSLLHRIAQVAAGFVALGLLVAVNLPQPAPMLQQVSYHIQIALLLGGIFLIAWGVSGISLPRFHLLLSPLFLITVLAFILRIVALEDAVHIFVDEFHSTEAVTQLNLNANIQILTAYNPLAAFPWLYPYLQSGAVGLFGHTLFGLRFVSVIVGTLTIPVLYLLARCLFDRPTALLAALFLATFPPHIHFSRLALINIVDPFVGTLVLAFLARALHSSRRSDYVLAGVCLGLTQYFYEGGKVLFPALTIAWLAILALFRRDRLSWRGMALLVVMAVVTAAPLYATLWAWGAPLFPRIAEQGGDLSGAGMLSSAYIQDDLLPPLLHLVHRPDAGEFYYGGHTPLILGYLVPIFLLGVFHALWRWRVSGMLLLLWLTLTLVGNSLLQSGTNVWTARYVIAFPSLALLIALGFRFTVSLLFRSLLENHDQVGQVSRDEIYLVPTKSTHQMMKSLVLSPFLVLFALLQPLYYFTVHLPVYNQQIRPYRDHIDVFYRARLLPPDTGIVVVTGDPVYEPHYEVLSDFWDFYPTVSIVDPASFTRDYLVGLPPGAYAFFIDGENEIAPALLRATYGEVERPQFSPYNVPLDRQYVMYHVPSLTP